MNTPLQTGTGRSCRARHAQRRATATVELAVVAPILLILALGTIDVGQLVNVSQMVTNASREGARLAARHTTVNVSEVETCVARYLAEKLSRLTTDSLGEALQVSVSDGSKYGIPEGDLTTLGTGAPITVDVRFQFDSVRWLRGVGIVPNRTLRSTTVMRRE